MTKLKNTKKGMAKKALSISLVAAMLATSNVPVWAAEFSDGEAVAFTSEAEVETPIVEEEISSNVDALPELQDVVGGNLSLSKTGVLKRDETISASTTNIVVSKGQSYQLNWYLGEKFVGIEGNKSSDYTYSYETNYKEHELFDTEGSIETTTYKGGLEDSDIGKYLTAALWKVETDGTLILAANTVSIEVVGKDANDYQANFDSLSLNKTSVGKGEIITINNTANQQHGATTTYQWYRFDSIDNETIMIDGANGDTYTTTADDIGYSVYPVATLETEIGVFEKDLSNVAVPVTGKAATDYISGTLSISANTTEITSGSKLTATVYTQHPGATVTYKWQKSDDNGKTWTDVEGKFNKTYTATREDINKSFRVAATVSVEGLKDTTKYSSMIKISEPTSSDVTAKWTGNGKTLTTTGSEVAEFGYVYKKGCDYKPDIASIEIGGVEYTYENGDWNEVTWKGTDKAGVATVQFQLKTSDKNNGKVINLKYNIAQADLDKAEVSFANTYVYAPADLEAESLKKAGMTVTLDGVELKAGADENDDVDYTLTATTAGSKKGTIVINDKTGNYKNSKTFTFDIAKMDVNDLFIKAIPDQYYTGKAIEAAPSIFYKESDTILGEGVSALKKITDYTLSWDNNLTIGTATVTVKGAGNYTGEKAVTFEIVNARLELYGLICEIYDSKEFSGKFVDKDGQAISSISGDDEEKAKDILNKISKGAYFNFEYTGYEQNPMLPAYGLNWTYGKEYSYSYVGQHKNAGDFNIKVEGEGNYGSSFVLPCKIEQFDISKFIAYDETTKKGNVKVADTIYNEKVTAANVNDLYKPEVSITWNNFNLLKDFDFEVKYDSANSYKSKKVTVELKGTGNFTGTKTFTGKIVEKSIGDASITVEPIENKKYDGSPIRLQSSDLKLKDGNNDLVLNKDFHIVEYKNNTNPGVATLVIGGMGNYTGTREITFLIVDREYDAYIMNLNGTPVLPDVKYDYNTANSEKGFVLTDGTDFVVKNADGDPIDTNNYEVTYENNKAAGTATIKVNGKDGFKISAINTFKITPKTLVFGTGDVTFKGNETSFIYTGDEIKPEVNVNLTDGKYKLVEGTDYEIVYSSNINVGKASVAVSGKGNYAGLNADNVLPKKELNYTITPATLTGSEVIAKDVPYAGGIEVTPDITVVNPISGKVLVLGTDYTVTLKNAINTGVAEATITLTESAAKNYNLTATAQKVKFNVTAKDLKDVVVTPIEDQVETGEQIKPAVVVMNGGIRLVEGYDFELTYGENKEVGEGTVTLKALDSNKNYTGEQTVAFNIVKTAKDKVGQAMIETVNVTGNKANIVLTGHAENAGGYDFVVSTEKDYKNGRVAISKNILGTDTNVYYLDQGTYYAYCHAWKRGEDGKKVFGPWSNLYKFEVTATTPETPVVKSVKVKGSTVTVTYTNCDDATGYDAVLGSTVKKVNGELRPTNYGKLVSKVYKGNTVTATFKNVKPGTYYAGLHAYNRTSEDGKKVFSPWSNTKKVTVK